MESVHAATRKCMIVLLNFLIIVSMASNATAEAEVDALLRLKNSFNNAGVLQSWQPGTKPCDENLIWEGIICSGDSVYGIRLEELNLSGTLDTDALLQLPGLRTLSFKSNSFSGPIPAINTLIRLRALYLANNKFSGEIPMEYFAEMSYLKKVWLSSNQFSGTIPLSLNIIPLIELHLENNQFSGSIPELNQSTILHLNLSNNNLTGPIPPGLSRFDEKTFEGNPGLCGEKAGKPCDEQPKEPPTPELPQEALTTEPPIQEPPPKENEQKHNDGKNDRKTISKWVMILSPTILVSMLVLLVFLRRKQERNHELPRENVYIIKDMSESGRNMPATKDTGVGSRKDSLGSNKGGGSREFTELTMVNDEKGEFRLSDLMKASAEVLGIGTLGSSYKATISNGFLVVVKRVQEMNKLEKDAFDAEMRSLGRINHKNVLPPLAYHYRKDEKLLITEYMPNGSLLYLLHGDKGSPREDLKWPVRLRIIQGIARGLFYIHTEFSKMELPHGNLKSSNVLLSPEYEPLLSEYGFSSLVTSTEATRLLFAYKSPEALLNQQVSPGCDVYCLGIIILELLTGKFPSQYLNNGKGGTDIVQWARSAIDEERELELFDPDVAGSDDALNEMEQLFHIGVACTEPELRKRLDIREAISRIEALHVWGSPSQQPHGMNSGSGPGVSSGHTESFS